MRKTDRGIYSKVISKLLGVQFSLINQDMSQAYNDNPHEIGYGATISAPHMHAQCLELLQDYLKPGAK
jgi:protein-L-isoaspartate(D-aspartate) O-methyltransferase